MAPKKATTKKVAAKAPAKKADPLFPARPRSKAIGGNIRPVNDLTRFLRWPKYLRIQRQRAGLYQRLKVPPPIFQITKARAKKRAITVFTLLNNYRPVTGAA